MMQIIQDLVEAIKEMRDLVKSLIDRKTEAENQLKILITEVQAMKKEINAALDQKPFEPSGN